MECQEAHMDRLGGRVVMAVLFAILADAVLYAQSPGAGLTLYAMLVAGAAAACYGRKLARAGLWPLLWLVLAAGALVDESLIGRALLVVLGWAIVAFVRLPENSTLLDALLRGTVGGFRSFGAAPRDARSFVLLNERRLMRNQVQRMPAWVYGLPLVLIIVFAALIIPANLVLARWWVDAFEALGHLFTNITLWRVALCAVFGLGTYGLLRFRLGRRPADVVSPARTAAADGGDLRNELRSCMLTFIGLNTIYLAANATDVAYLWLSTTLPPGITYAQFAHQGSYRLIVAVVLAAVTVTAFFRLGTLQSLNGRARWLAYAFVIQNMLVLLGAGRRLMLYVEVYGLTRWRAATFIWLALVLIGFVLIWIKIQRVRPFGFLANANAVSSIFVLSITTFLNIEGFIADWNVTRYEAGSVGAVDVAYLAELDTTALPALKRLAVVPDEAIALRASAALTRMYGQAARDNMQWPSWTWRRACVLESVAPAASP